MTIRLGSGTIQAGRKLDVKELECISSDDPLQEYPELLKNAYEKIDTDKKLVIAGGASHTNDYLEHIKARVLYSLF